MASIAHPRIQAKKGLPFVPFELSMVGHQTASMRAERSPVVLTSWDVEKEGMVVTG